MIGTSYDGFTVTMALLDPHPALKAAVPESPKIENWMGDEWYHYGAFRQIYLDYFAFMTAQRGAGSLEEGARHAPTWQEHYGEHCCEPSCTGSTTKQAEAGHLWWLCACQGGTGTVAARHHPDGPHTVTLVARD